MSRQPLSATLFKLHDPSNTGIAGSPLYRPVLNKFIAAVERHDWADAALEMKDSRWHRQVQNRSSRLIERMLAV